MDSSIRIPNSKFQIRSGFTVVEMVLVLSLLVLFVGATVPAVRGLKNEQIAREPVKELSSMAKEATSSTIEVAPTTSTATLPRSRPPS